MSLSEEALEAFEALKQACMNSPVLAFADYTKDFLLETVALKEGLGAVLSQKQEDGWFHPVAYSSQALTTQEKNYHSMKLEFLALKWAVTEHFKEYLLYQPFLVKKSPPVANVLVFQDHLTKHVLVFVTPNQTAKTIDKFLYGGYISISGALARLLSDRGTSFTSSIIEELCKILGIQ